MSDADVVALINTDGEPIAVWHVAIGVRGTGARGGDQETDDQVGITRHPTSRLCGAWIDVTAPALLADRLLLPFDDQLPDALQSYESASAGIFDPVATRDAILDRITELDEVHQSTPTKAGLPRAPIAWPKLPEPFDWKDPPQPPRGVADDPLVSPLIAVARWIAYLADAWSTVEVNRLSRQHLAGNETTSRQIPVVVRNATPA
jgi:hypothetical protein